MMGWPVNCSHGNSSSAREILAGVSEAQANVQNPELSGRIALCVPDDFRITDLHRTISRCLTEPLLWVYNRRVAFNDLTELPLVAFPDGCAYRRAALATLERRVESSFFAYTSASYENIRSAVSAGLGIGILPAGATTPDHFILTAREGFPTLPNVRLMLLYRSQGTLLSQLAEVLRRLVTQNTGG